MRKVVPAKDTMMALSNDGFGIIGESTHDDVRFASISHAMHLQCKVHIKNGVRRECGKL